MTHDDMLTITSQELPSGSLQGLMAYESGRPQRAPGKRRITAGLAVALVAALSLSACSSDDDDEQADSGLPGLTDGGLDGDSTDGGATDGGAAGGSQISPGGAESPRVASTAIGSVLTTPDDGRTLYLRPGDTPDEVSCVDDCAVTWPPMTTELDTSTAGALGFFGIIARPDGTHQFTLAGYPLHLYSGDAGSGDTTGEGVEAGWHAARLAPVTSGETELGETLVVQGSIVTATGDVNTRDDVDGRTLYVFADDTAGVSNCNAGCATNWPPLYADAGAIEYDTDEAESNYSIITRDDSTRQWAFQGQALYLYAGDSMPGDVLGEGVGGKWSALTQ